MSVIMLWELLGAGAILGLVWVYRTVVLENRIDWNQNKIDGKLNKDRERLIKSIESLDDHYVIETPETLDRMTIRELERTLQKYIRALQEDVGSV